jgi:hypothetical protein
MVPKSLFVLLLVLSLAVQQPAANNGAALRGHIRDTEQKPLAAALLSLYDDCRDPSHDPCKNIIRNTSSAKDGSFFLGDTDLKPGVYGLMAKADGRLPMMWIPINIPGDYSKMFELVLPSAQRNDVGQIIVSPEQAKLIFAAAKVNKDEQLIFLASQILKNFSNKEPEGQFYAFEAFSAFNYLAKKSVLQFNLPSNSEIPASEGFNLLAVNRLTGESFEGHFFGTTMQLPVTAIGTYDLFVSSTENASLPMWTVNNLPVMFGQITDIQYVDHKRVFEFGMKLQF